MTQTITPHDRLNVLLNTPGIQRYAAVIEEIKNGGQPDEDKKKKPAVLVDQKPKEKKPPTPGRIELMAIAARTFNLWSDTPAIIAELTHSVTAIAQIDVELRQAAEWVQIWQQLRKENISESDENADIRSLLGELHEAMQLHPTLKLTAPSFKALEELALNKRRFAHLRHETPKTPVIHGSSKIVSGHLLQSLEFRGITMTDVQKNIIALMESVRERLIAIGRHLFLVEECELYLQLSINKQGYFRLIGMEPSVADSIKTYFASPSKITFEELMQQVLVKSESTERA